MRMHLVPDITDIVRTVPVHSPSGIKAEQRAGGWPAHPLGAAGRVNPFCAQPFPP